MDPEHNNITILDMKPFNFVNDKADVWLCCTPISKSVEYVHKHITVRFSNENFEDDIKIKEFMPEDLLIIEISKDFYKKYESNATIKIINNALCASENVLVGSSQIPNTVSTSTTSTYEFQNDSNQQYLQTQNQKYLQTQNQQQTHLDLNVDPDINDVPEILPVFINDAEIDQVLPELSRFPYIPTVLAENLLEMFDN